MSTEILTPPAPPPVLSTVYPDFLTALLAGDRRRCTLAGELLEPAADGPVFSGWLTVKAAKSRSCSSGRSPSRSEIR